MKYKPLNSLRRFRRANFYTRNDMADELGIAKSTYIKVESGIRKPSFAFMYALKNKFPRFNLNLIIAEIIDQEQESKRAKYTNQDEELDDEEEEDMNGRDNS